MLVSKGVEEDGISGDVEGLRKARFVGGVGSSSWSISSIPSTLSGAISLFGSMFKLSSGVGDREGHPAEDEE